MVISLTSKHFCLTFLPNGYVYDQTLIVFAFESNSAWATMSSNVHRVWAEFQGATLEGRPPRYNVKRCFQAFPFAEGYQAQHKTRGAAGKTCFEFRADLMVRNDEGLTATYNRLHDPDEQNPQVIRLRELHDAMDRAVLEAYGWGDLETGCDFLLDYEIDEEEWGNKKKPYRYRWPDEVRDEILARLLELNAERAREEARSGAATSKQDPEEANDRPRTQGSQELRTSSHERTFRTQEFPPDSLEVRERARRGSQVGPCWPLARTCSR